MLYRIIVDGNVSERVSAVFPHLATTEHGRYHQITGDVRDQAQLHGVLSLIGALNVSLISLSRVEDDHAC
ncbi:MAG: hypothetical protein ACR2QK_21580 [Acidimicrobiales bacterium]